MESSKQALILGGGLVGSLWAIFMARRGYDITVFERRSDMRKAGYVGGRSINLALSHRGWKAISNAGIGEEIRKVAIPMSGRMIHSLDGQLRFQPYGKADEAIYSVSRGGLNQALIEIAESKGKVRFEFDSRCAAVDLEKGNITIENTATGVQQVHEAPLIFGADGAFSVLRGALQKTDMFNYSQQYLDYGYKELTIPALEGGGFRMEKNALHIWPRKNFMLIALPNIDGSFTCTLFLPFKGEDGVEHLQTDEQVMEYFVTYFPDAVPMMPDLLEDFRNNPTSSLVTVKCHPWHYDHRFLLIGDAAHAIVPFFGQGMNAGFEDCTILDNLIEQQGEDWEYVIDSFDRQRYVDTNAIAELAVRNFTEMRDLVADPAFQLRQKIAARLHEKYPEQFTPLYSMVTFSHLPYHIALRESGHQDNLFERILRIPGIEDNWQEDPEVDRVFLEWSQEQGM